jgi:predicted nucleic acid-binding protein
MALYVPPENDYGAPAEPMGHVFVESNWVYSYSAPAHHKRQDAVNLLVRAENGEIRLHVPAICLTEARQAILARCQPRAEANAVRRFLARGRNDQTVSDEEDRVTRLVLQRFEHQVQAELRSLDDSLAALRAKPGVDVFPLSERMLERAVELTGLNLSLKPFDQAILAAVPGRARELSDEGEREFCFCELDSDLQPWDKSDNAKQPLTGLYDAEFVWVYGDFSMEEPKRPEGWPRLTEA